MLHIKCTLFNKRKLLVFCTYTQITLSLYIPYNTSILVFALWFFTLYNKFSTLFFFGAKVRQQFREMWNFIGSAKLNDCKRFSIRHNVITQNIHHVINGRIYTPFCAASCYRRHKISSLHFYKCYFFDCPT